MLLRKTCVLTNWARDHCWSIQHFCSNLRRSKIYPILTWSTLSQGITISNTNVALYLFSVFIIANSYITLTVRLDDEKNFSKWIQINADNLFSRWWHNDQRKSISIEYPSLRFFISQLWFTGGNAERWDEISRIDVLRDGHTLLAYNFI